jgi:hypothetical protein
LPSPFLKDAPAKRLGKRRQKSGKALHDHVHLPDRSAIADAAELIERFGIHALSEASARADRSRELGNVIHFCRWRQIERLIPILASDRAPGTIH